MKRLPRAASDPAQSIPPTRRNATDPRRMADNCRNPKITTPYTMSEDKVEITWPLSVSRLMQRPPEGYLVHQVDIRCFYKVPDSGMGITDMEFLMRQLCAWNHGEFVSVGAPVSDPSVMYYHLRTFSARRAVRVADFITYCTTATLTATTVVYALIE